MFAKNALLPSDVIEGVAWQQSSRQIGVDLINEDQLDFRLLITADLVADLCWRQ